MIEISQTPTKTQKKRKSPISVKPAISLDNLPGGELVNTQLHTDFVYPNELPPDLKEEVEEYVQHQGRLVLCELVRRLILLLQKDKTPVLTLRTLLVLYNLDTDSLRQVAKDNSTTHQRLGYIKKNIDKKIVERIHSTMED
jgi:predicted house-cleaning noncanonical NTP pyrophosphatase (MazG superfamily)